MVKRKKYKYTDNQGYFYCIDGNRYGQEFYKWSSIKQLDLGNYKNHRMNGISIKIDLR